MRHSQKVRKKRRRTTLSPNPIFKPDNSKKKNLMKRKILLLSIASILALTGCQRLSSFLAKPQTQAQAVIVPPHLTNILQTVPQPAQVTVVTQTVAGQTYYTTNTVQLPDLVFTNTVYVLGRTETQQVVVGYAPNPSVLQGLTQAQQWNSTLNPTPSAPLVNIGIGILTALATGFAGWKTKQLQSQPKIDALQSVIKAVETFVEAPPTPTGIVATVPVSVSDQLKAHITTTANLDNTEAALSKEVKAVTNS